MISAEDESVRFAKKVVPAQARGLVEKWLLQVGNQSTRVSSSTCRGGKWVGTLVLCCSI